MQSRTFELQKYFHALIFLKDSVQIQLVSSPHKRSSGIGVTYAIQLVMATGMRALERKNWGPCKTCCRRIYSAFTIKRGLRLFPGCEIGLLSSCSTLFVLFVSRL